MEKRDSRFDWQVSWYGGYLWLGLGVRDRSNLNRRFFDASEDSFYGRSVCSNLRPIIERDW